MRLSFAFVIVLAFSLTSSCRKKDKSDPIDDQPSPMPVVPSPIISDTNFKCYDLPPTPKPFGWTDSTLDVEKNIIAFIYNPINSDELIYVAQGNVSASNLIRNHNIVTGASLQLGNAGPYLPSVNNKGLVLFSSADDDLYIVKSNGDSLKQITFNNLGIAPHWDFSGKHLYYFSRANFIVASQIIKSSADGKTTLNSFFADLPHMASFNKSDRLLFLKPSATDVTIVEKDMVSMKERELIGGPYNQKTGDVHFNHLCVDRNDQFFYWTNSLGLFRCNLTTLKVDTIHKNCPNFTLDGPIVSFRSNELTYSKHDKKPISSFIMFHQYRAMELDLLTGKSTEVPIFPNK